MDLQCIKESGVPPKSLIVQMANLRGWPSANESSMLDTCPVDLFSHSSDFSTNSSSDVLASRFPPLPPQYTYSSEDCT